MIRHLLSALAAVLIGTAATANSIRSCDTWEANARNIVLLPELEVLNDGPQKPVSIATQVGRRPILAVGNIGGGDQEMLRWSQSADRPNLQLLVLHDDAERELEYGEAADVDAARQAGWQIISMASDWNRVFSRPLARQEPIEPAEAASSPR